MSFQHRRLIPALALIAAASGCATKPPPAPAPVAVVEEVAPEELDLWRQVATGKDQSRVEQAGTTWSQALAQIRERGRERELAAEEGLLDPTVRAPRPELSPGPYRCRIVKLGRDDRGPVLVSFKPYFCYIDAEADVLTIVKQTGSQRPVGRLYTDRDDPMRLIFLGTMTLGDEEEPIPYGEDPQRDLAGVLERVAPFRWRLAIPHPGDGTIMEVMELVPAVEPATLGR